MSFSLIEILIFIVAYLSALFAVAHMATRGVIPERITNHPAIYVLSLGVFAGATATNGILELAYRYGYGFFMYCFGVGLLFLLSNLLLFPLLRLCRVYQLASLADILTFRFRSTQVGSAVTIAISLAVLPLLALQIEAVAHSIHYLSGNIDTPNDSGKQHGLAQLFCIIITVFSILFGTRHRSSQERNTGLVTAIAFESLVKLSAMLILMLVAIYQVFGSPAQLQDWLSQMPITDGTELLPGDSDPTRAFLLVFFAGAVCMPHIFHMTFAENHNSRDLHTATWGLPLYLLLLSLPVLPLTWAGIKLNQGLPVDFSGISMGLALQSAEVSTIAFIASLSAASALIIVTTLALTNMIINHLILPSPLLRINREQSVYVQLRWFQRSTIAVMILASYTLFVALEGDTSLATLALTAFSGTLQFLPGIVATLYWPTATRMGLLAGLAGGLLLWLGFILTPAITDFQPVIDGVLFKANPDSTIDYWTQATLASLLLNTAIFIVVSLLTRRTADEMAAAEICSMDRLPRQPRQTLDVHSAAQFADRLTPALGEKTAHQVLQRALSELRFSVDETRPYALRRLRSRLEANLSGLLGPSIAHRIIEQCLPFQTGMSAASQDINLIERNLDSANLRLTGMAANLDNLRRHYRETLDNLPIGVCSVTSDHEVVMWNRAMEETTGITAMDVAGALVLSLPTPWAGIIGDFLQGREDSILKLELPVDDGSSRWISLHRTTPRDGETVTDTVVLVEDITEFELLEEELLHSERLASIGRLAAGVAHEIGNPVTGIACLAQNLEYESDPEEVRESARDIRKQTDRISRIVESLVNFSRTGSAAGATELGPTNLADCVDEAVALLELDRRPHPVTFDNLCDRELVVLADNQRLLQVFINLLSNARDACDEDGLVQVRAHRQGDRVTIDVDDNGCGIPLHQQSQIFEPFYTTKEPGEGTGLGLALVFSIMADMGGTIEITSPIDEGPHPGTRCRLGLTQASYSREFDL